MAKITKNNGERVYFDLSDEGMEELIRTAKRMEVQEEFTDIPDEQIESKPANDASEMVLEEIMNINVPGFIDKLRDGLSRLIRKYPAYLDKAVVTADEAATWLYMLIALNAHNYDERRKRGEKLNVGEQYELMRENLIFDAIIAMLERLQKYEPENFYHLCDQGCRAVRHRARGMCMKPEKETL